ncbi:Trna-Dihydrouridine(20A/20B) Synthase [Nad(P)+]-Like [Manis pentadactyla]|nr:Trna-Dihydrouridine(20A/20B) Synthase [Nad(P)+]-Like [Manis pentadactyla]
MIRSFCERQGFILREPSVFLKSDFMSAHSTNGSCLNEPLTAKICFHQMGMLHQERAPLQHETRIFLQLT